MKHTQFQKYAPFAIILIGLFSRFIAHPANVAPIAALALFSGLYLKNKYALFLPLIALFLSDLAIGFYGPTMIAVYASFLLVGAIGIILQKKKNVLTMILATLTGSVLFYVITNFSVWLFSTMYPHTLSGLLSCYTLAIPFFRNTIIGDAVYVLIFCGGYELLSVIQNSYANHTSHTRLHLFS